MEAVLNRPPVKEERRVEHVVNEDAGETGKFGGETPIADQNFSRPPSRMGRKDSTISKQDQLESTKAEMGEVREENERLKMILAQIVKDYQSLQMHFFEIVQQEQAKKPRELAPPVTHDVAEPELVSLSLGTNSSGHMKEEKINANKSKENGRQIEGGLTLGLDCKFERSSTNEPVSNVSPDNSFEEAKEEEPGEPWPPSKILKNLRNNDDEVSQQPPVKKARVSVRARCDAPTMNDGCQWRKYGQKIAKGNPCPRAYYRCTVAPACPVRKQVQRCAEDMSILITTYEGTHNHPLPVSATAMASTTAAAACMLMSGSSTSQQAAGNPANSAVATTANANLHGLNFMSMSDHLRPRQFYLPNSTISSNPTITLDLTAPPSSTSQFSISQTNFSSAPRYSSTGFSFSSSEANAKPPTSWSNIGQLSYSSSPFNKSPMGSLSLGRQAQDPSYLSYLHKANSHSVSAPSQHLLTDSIAKAISSDPSFQSVLAAAITSYVGNHGAQGGGEGPGHGPKWGEQFNSVPSYSAAPAGNGCASSYLTRPTGSSSNQQQGSLVFLQPSLAFAGSKSASASPADKRENIN